MATRFSRGRGGVGAELEAGEVQLLDTLFADVATLLADPEPPSGDPLAVELGLADLGIATDARLPADPALARLLPDASRDDPQAAADFRRYTERGLRRSKLAGLAAVRATLARPGQDSGWLRRLAGDEAPLHLRLDDDSARAWVVALTDLRLVLADRLGVRTDEDAEALHAGRRDPDDPADPAAAAAASAEADSADAQDPQGRADPQVSDEPGGADDRGGRGGEEGEWLAMVYDFVTWLQESLTEVLLADLPVEGDGRRPLPPGLAPS